VRYRVCLRPRGHRRRPSASSPKRSTTRAYVCACLTSAATFRPNQSAAHCRLLPSSQARSRAGHLSSRQQASKPNNSRFPFLKARSWPNCRDPRPRRGPRLPGDGPPGAIRNLLADVQVKLVASGNGVDLANEVYDLINKLQNEKPNVSYAELTDILARLRLRPTRHVYSQSHSRGS
jgi:hypothetical protein